MVDAIIKGCLFHWKQCLNRKFKAVVGYVDNELLRNDLHTVFGLAFVDYFQKDWLYNRCGTAMKLPSPMILGQTARSTPLPDACHLRYIALWTSSKDSTRSPSWRSSRRLQGYKQHGSHATTPSRWRSELRRRCKTTGEKTSCCTAGPLDTSTFESHFNVTLYPESF